MATTEANSDITFISPCIDYFTFSSETQVDPASDNFSGAEMTFTLTEFSMSPARCEVTYACTNVERVDGATSSIECSDLTFDGIIDRQGNDGVLTFSANRQDYIDETFTPGAYRVTITGTAVGSAPTVTKDATFILTLVDPCDPPISVTGEDLINQSYTCLLYTSPSPRDA